MFVRKFKNMIHLTWRELRETGGRRSSRVEGAQRTNKRGSKWGGRGSNRRKRSP